MHPQSAQPPQHDSEPIRDWKAHWKTQGQPWRTEPEIDLERQQSLQQQLTDKFIPFDGIALGRADLEWLIRRYQEKNVDEEEQPHRLNLRSAILSAVDYTFLPLEGADFSEAQLQGNTYFFRAQLQGADFSGARLNDARFRNTQLQDARFRHAQLKGADFSEEQLQGADFRNAQLQGANFYRAQLQDTNFSGAHLQDAIFAVAQLQGANFSWAQLQGAYFAGAQLQGAHFRSAAISNATFEDATIVTVQKIGPIVADVMGWDERSLPIREWSQVKLLGDEAEAKNKTNKDGKRKDATTRFEGYFAATRAYRQIATALDGMGRKEEAEKFAYRGQVMQRKMLWWSIWQKKRTIWQRLADGRAWLFSWLLTLLSGYGYRFGRSLGWYLGILTLFAFLYWSISQGIPLHSNALPHLSWLDAAILSISDMVGRGFFRQDMPTYLSDPYAGWSVLEGMIGVFMDVLLISTLTQRLFKK